jgi:hypothetical protein
MLKCAQWRLVPWLASLSLLACSDGGDSGGEGGTAGQPSATAGSSGAGGQAGAQAGSAASGVSGVGSAAGSGGSAASGGVGGVAGSGGNAGDGVDPSDGGVTPDASGPGTVIGEPDDDSSYVFDQTQLRSYDLIIAQAELDMLNQNPQAEQYVQGMVEHEGEQYGPVGIRYKGSVGAFQPPCTGGGGGAKVGKCSVKVAFDFLDDEARFHDLKKLNFHSMNNDASQLRERLVYAMFRENGVAAPRAVHARLLINGQLEGLFVIVEQIDGRFTRSRFTEGGKGNLYKEIWPQYDDAATYLAALETNRDEMPSAARAVAFNAAIAEGPEAAAEWIDREYVLRYLAADRVTINDDGALHWWCTPLGQGNNPGGIGNHNYYWYEATSADRFWLIPWDADMALAANPYVLISPEWREPGTCTCNGGGGFSSRAASCDPLIGLWASWNADYEAAVDAFLAGPFSEVNVNAKLDAWTAQIDPVVRESEGLNAAPFYADWQSASEILKTVIRDARTHRGSMY